MKKTKLNLKPIEDQLETIIAGLSPFRRIQTIIDLAKQVNEFAYNMHKRADKIRAEQKNNVQCPHCGEYLERKPLRDNREHKYIRGIERHSWSGGPFDGWHTEVLETDFVRTKCPCCKKWIYAEYSSNAPMPFNGKVFAGPEAFY